MKFEIKNKLRFSFALLFVVTQVIFFSMRDPGSAVVASVLEILAGFMIFKFYAPQLRLTYLTLLAGGVASLIASLFALGSDYLYLILIESGLIIGLCTSVAFSCAIVVACVLVALEYSWNSFHRFFSKA